MSIRLAVINHKGGVGKTTLVFNLAAELAERGLRVLCVDADPQCNLSVQVLGEERLDHLLDTSDGPNGRTIWSLLNKRDRGRNRTIAELFGKDARHPIALIPGDVQLHRFEDELAIAWSRYRESLTESLEILTRLGRRISIVEDDADIDFTLIDTAPSLGPVNRSVVLDSDFVVVPVGIDLFSARGLKTLGRTMASWVKDWETISRFAPTDLLTRLGEPALGGYVLQRVPPSGRKRTTGIGRIQKRVKSDLVVPLRKVNHRLARGREIDLRLGSVPEAPFIHAAQEDSKTAWDDHPSFRKHFQVIADRLATRINRMK